MIPHLLTSYKNAIKLLQDVNSKGHSLRIISMGTAGGDVWKLPMLATLFIKKKKCVF